ncbi:hypothetical protein BVRB_1g020920 [Beta vulgaris subsp. vulgaris]|nr:hypothetical protein BVRB_1g020920 [Beta vulgaris subsp. vulgaris]
MNLELIISNLDEWHEDGDYILRGKSKRLLLGVETILSYLILWAL